MKKIIFLLTVVLLFITFTQLNAEVTPSKISGPGNSAATFERYRSTECPANTLFGQEPSLPSEFWNAYTSEEVSGFIVYENFWEINEDICDIHFWGLNLSHDGIWELCDDEDPMTFEIKFYTDNSGVPDTNNVVCSYIRTINRVSTGLSYDNGMVVATLYYYSTELEPCCTLSDGWVSIEGKTSDPDCWFLWMNSQTGDGVGYQLQSGSLFNIENDLSLCLTGEEQQCKMHYPQTPDITPEGVDVYTLEPKTLADDFQCTESGLITDITIWTSWKYDELPDSPPIFYLSIWSDNPNGPGGFSQPNEQLWSKDFTPDSYTYDTYSVTNGEHWWNPNTGELIFPGDWTIWQYDFTIPQSEAFEQDEGTIYWLAVQAALTGPEQVEIGWKTTMDHWNDDAVWSDLPFEYWNEMIYPDGHPFSGESMDLAFTIYGSPIQVNREYGDAPEGANAIAYPSLGVTGAFPTCIGCGPAGYIEHNNFGAYFGPTYDFENEGNAGFCPNCFPPYDQDECFMDGDAGLIMPEPFTIDATYNVIPCPNGIGTPLGYTCSTAVWGTNIDIDVYNFMPGHEPYVDGYVNVLIDWNQDGQWQYDQSTMCGTTVVPEHVLVDFLIPPQYSGPLSGLLPPSFQIGPNPGYVWARFSITEVPVGDNWNGEGIFEDGETEDYLLWVIEEEPEEYDFGDAPDDDDIARYPTLLTHNGARHVIDYVTFLGDTIDAETDGIPNATATGDDWNNLDDEDGVFFNSVLVPGYSTYVKVNASTNGYLNGWVDFNCNDSWTDSLEHIFNDVMLSPGNNYLTFNVPPNAVIETTYARFRFSTVPGLADTGYAADGEVEDYEVTIHDTIPDAKMHFPQWPDPYGWDVKCSEPNLIADDWKCIESGPVTDIHFWVSWYTGDGYYGLIDSIHISIHENIPEPPYSMPGALLWERNFMEGEFEYVEYWDHGLQGWYDPMQQFYYPEDHEYFDQINITNIPNPFNQEEGKIYWLDIKVFINPQYPDYQLGWKTSQFHWMDNAVYFVDNVWLPLEDPITYEPLDMAFVITGSEVPEELDYGDALEPIYPTLLASNGARHALDGVTYLGNQIDAEFDGQPNSAAVGDDNNPTPTDEDGVVFTSTLVPGSTANVTITASVFGLLNGWVDFDGGGWNTANEHIFNDVNLNVGANPLTFNVPASAILGTTYARFRFSTVPGLADTGYADDGEVEDYMIEIAADSCKMHFVQWPDLTTNGVDVSTMWEEDFEGNLLADDFFCTETGYVTDIHIWGSWVEDWYLEDWMPPFKLGIWSDQPAGPTFSQPETCLWEKTFQPTEYNWSIYSDTDGEWFYYPMNQYGWFPGDSLVFKFDFYIDESEAFVQEDSTVYWLSVTAIKTYGYDPIFGWKSSVNHWNDDAVWYYWTNWSDSKSAKQIIWNELFYPYEHPLYPESMDLAFFISGTPIPSYDLDFGDAPDPAGAMMYPTTLASNGARHTIDGITYLGTMIDGEADGWQSSDALGDDTHGFPDEDGVIFQPILVGSPAQIIVTTSDSGYLQGWMDFNQDGDWHDVGEQIFTDTFIHFGDSICLNYIVPATADTGYTFARFRYSTTPGLADTGYAPDGEVEDYRVQIIDYTEVKWLQLPCEELTGLHCHDEHTVSYNATIIADDWQCNGGLVTDIHWWGNYEQVNQGIDHFHLSIHANDPLNCLPLDPELWGVDVPLIDANETATGMYNVEGCEIFSYEYYLTEPFEQVEGQTYWLDICAYSNNPYYPNNVIWRWQESARSTAPILCPASSKTLTTPVWQHINWTILEPWRFSDMAFAITSVELPTHDFGDAPDSLYKTLLTSDGARHFMNPMVYLGKCIDAEADGFPTTTALGDDNNNTDDEDGVIFTTLAHPGDTLFYYVRPSVDGYLHAWFDLNADGDWTDPNEHVLNSVNVTGGINNNFSEFLPATMPTGISYSRFRFTTVDTTLSYKGPASDGEVEDYRLFVRDSIEDMKMHFPQWPDLDTTGVDVRLSQMQLADDWQCTETGYVSDIHFWASFESDILPDGGPEQLQFLISIYDNIPAGQGQSFSRPGDLLWQMYFDQYWYTVTQVTDNNPEDWYDPITQSYIHNNHLECYQYDIDIVESPFIQEKDSIYWISIQEMVPYKDYYTIGWKTTDTLHHFMDDAVYYFDDVKGWSPLYYPDGHLWEGHTIDLSFVITGEPVYIDFGDTPDSYKTTLASNGARHLEDLYYNPILGDTIDFEPDGQPSADALGDDNNILYPGAPDDEDGVVFTSNLVQGVIDTVIVTTSSGGYLNTWIDYNCDGDFADTLEHVFDDYWINASGKDTLAFTVPSGATADTTYARFRFSWDYDLDYYGISYSGEVEDYQVIIEERVIPLDYGDAPDPTYPTLRASNGARHAFDDNIYLGNQIDTENDGWQSITALGDDNHALNDEDGVVFTCPLIPGEQGAITVKITSTVLGYFNGWIDFNDDGDWLDPGEHIFVDSIRSSGFYPFNFNVPAGASLDSTYARFRLSTIPGLADSGFAPDGEVEDYRIEIIEKPDDDCKMHFHQWPDTTWTGMDVKATDDLILADDFLCMETGIINSIHLWSSWLYDNVGEPTFYLSIWSNIPEGPYGYSQPGQLLWGRFFGPGQYCDSLYFTSRIGEFWYDPIQGYTLYPADFQIRQYDFAIPDSEAFVQEEGTIYWLGMSVYGVPTPDLDFGWKTSVNHWNDDAVWGVQPVKDRQMWYELRYPYDHPFHPHSIDFSFYINCTPTTPIVNISVSSDTVYVTWDPVPCADTYTVYSSTDPYATFPSGWTVEQTGIMGTSWCENASSLTKKFYKVVAVK